MNPSEKKVSTRLIRSEETRTLRGAILRPGHPPEACNYEGDDAPNTFHLGVFAADALVGIASFYSEALPEEIAALMKPENGTPVDGSYWRLRGMAVDAGLQGSGYGKAVLEAGIAQIADQGGGLLWCNARSCALGFYRRLEFSTWGEEFLVPNIGPHFVMTYRVKPSINMIGLRDTL